MPAHLLAPLNAALFRLGNGQSWRRARFGVAITDGPEISAEVTVSTEPG